MAEITGIVPLRGVRGRMRVYLDEAYAFTVSEKNIVRMGLQVGAAIDPVEILKAVREDEKERALRAVLYYLGRAERSRAQAVRYLEAREYLPPVVNSVMEKIEEYGYVNDARFAGMLLNHRAKAKGKSRRTVRCEMREKGLDEHTIEDAMALYGDRDEWENAMRAAQKIYDKNQGDKEAFKRKAGAALARRGYDWDVIRQVLHALQNNEYEEEA